jgi:protein-S-isoprenylcysteine O-methyltransferase Ste14
LIVLFQSADATGRSSSPREFTPASDERPAYLGFLLILLAWAAALSNVLALLSLPAFVLYMNRFQIVPEERMLASRFARDYAEYRARVRRWL